MAWDESKVNHINQSNPKVRPVPPVTPPHFTLLNDGTMVKVRNAVRIDPSEGPILGNHGFQHPGNEHYYLCTNLCKQHKFTKAFDGLMFSRMEFYDRSLMRVVVDRAARCPANPHGILGFSNVWHKVRTPYTKIYFFVTHKDHLRKGVGRLLFEDLMSNLPPGHGVELDVNKTNPDAIAFWRRQGFTTRGTSIKDTCWYMVRECE